LISSRLAKDTIVFIVELLTTSGRVCEPFETLEEARHRVESFPPDNLVTLPLIFEILPDGSERLVRDDGKPLQWHRPSDDAATISEERLPLADALPNATIQHLPPPEDRSDIEDIVGGDEA
jgi:hypothetical protein